MIRDNILRVKCIFHQFPNRYNIPLKWTQFMFLLIRKKYILVVINSKHSFTRLMNILYCLLFSREIYGREDFKLSKAKSRFLIAKIWYMLTLNKFYQPWFSVIWFYHSGIEKHYFYHILKLICRLNHAYNTINQTFV